jgi:hypothetical protein
LKEGKFDEKIKEILEIRKSKMQLSIVDFDNVDGKKEEKKGDQGEHISGGKKKKKKQKKKK